MRRLYISLPITGRVKAAKARALELKQSMRELFEEVVTPFDCSPHSEKPYAYHMGKCIECLLECTHVYFDEGWDESKGCCLEYLAAEIYGVKTVDRAGSPAPLVPPALVEI